MQANDFERYKELMAQEQDAAANEKIEVIERFLRDTEEYLTRLTEKIASVQLNQEASTAAAAATADARAQASLTCLGLTAQTVASALCSSAAPHVAFVLSCFTSPFGRGHAIPSSPGNGPTPTRSPPSSRPWISCKAACSLQLIRSAIAQFRECTKTSPQLSLRLIMQGKSEEEVLAIGKAAAAEAAATVEKSVEDNDDMDDDAQARYYRCAGRPGASQLKDCRVGAAHSIAWRSQNNARPEATPGRGITCSS